MGLVNDDLDRPLLGCDRRARWSRKSGPVRLPARGRPDPLALTVEIGDWHRFTGNTIGSFVGLAVAAVAIARELAGWC